MDAKISCLPVSLYKEFFAGDRTIEQWSKQAAALGLDSIDINALFIRDMSMEQIAQIRKALTAYGVQLGLNFLWPLVFFGGKMYLTAFIVLVALWVAIVVTMRRFMKRDEKAGDLLIPYLLWVSFAAYLNLGVFLLN